MLEVVIGNRLRDISRAVISKIDISDDLSSENFVVVPDRFSLIAEKMVFDELGISSTFNIQVVGISKLARIILEESSVLLDVLSQDECKLTLLKILKNCELKSFKEKNFMLAEEFLKIISQLKSNNIKSSEFLESVKDKNEKLMDIAKVFSLYEKEIENKDDASDILTKLVENLNKKLNHNYFFAEFDSFTEQGRLILEKLILNAKRVVVGALLPSNQKNAHNYDNDILNKINKLCRENKINYKKTYITNETTNEQEHILKNIYGFNSTKIDNKNSYIFNFATPEEEIKNIAKIINFEIHTNKKRFLDFNILTPKMENLTLFERIFNEYNIPYFIDSGTFASETEIVVFINTIFNFVKNESIETFLSALKCFYSQINLEQYSDVQNYFIKEGVFEINKIFEENIFSEEVVSFSRKLIEIKKFFNQCYDCEDYIKLVEKILEIFEIEKLNQSLIQEFILKNEIKLEKIYKQIDKRITDGLETLKKYIDITLSFDEFTEIFMKILNSKEIFSVPTALDCVFIGDSTKSFFEERAVLFVCQATQGALPVVLKDASVLSDRDIEDLNNLEINPTVRLINKRNKFKLLQNLTLAKRKVIISYSSTALGEKEEASTLISEIQKIFTKDGKKIGIYSSIFDLNAKDILFEKDSFLDIQNKADCNNIIIDLIFKDKITVGKFKEVITIKTNIFNSEFLSMLDKQDDKIIVADLLNNLKNKEKISNPRELFFKKNKISASQMEEFYRCPFKHFFTYGLRLKENEVCEFDGRDIGNFFHIVADKFVKNFKDFDSFDFVRDFNKLIDSVYNEKERLAKLRDNPNNKYMIIKLKNEAKMLIEQIALEQKWSDFKIHSTEKFFNYKLENSFNFIGCIDRIDTSDEYFRVVDYKSGEIKQSLNGVYHGVELQLFLYLLSMREELKLKPVAGLHFPIGSDFEDGNSFKKLLLSGFILNDDSIIKKLDKRLSPSYLTSDIITIVLTPRSSNEKLMVDNRKTRIMLSEKEFESLLKYTEKLLYKVFEDILTGNIFATPLKGKTFCEYCEYFTICSFAEEDSPRESKKIEKANFINIVERM